MTLPVWPREMVPFVNTMEDSHFQYRLTGVLDFVQDYLCTRCCVLLLGFGLSSSREALSDAGSFCYGKNKGVVEGERHESIARRKERRGRDKINSCNHAR